MFDRRRLLDTLDRWAVEAMRPTGLGSPWAAKWLPPLLVGSIVMFAVVPQRVALLVLLVTVAACFAAPLWKRLRGL